MGRVIHMAFALPPYSCRSLCAALRVLGSYEAEHKNPADAAEDAEMRAKTLAFAVIEVWDGGTRVLVWKRTRGAARVR